MTATIDDKGKSGEYLRYVVDTNEKEIFIYGIEEFYSDKTQREEVQKYQTTIQKVIIDEGITIIRNETFKGFSAMTSIEFSSTVETIESVDVFDECESLKEIVVDTNNNNYRSDNGVLIDQKDKTKKTLMKYPVAKEGETYTIPNEVTVIGTRSFETSKNLKTMIIPSTITEIQDFAFRYCESMTEFTVTTGNTNYESKEDLFQVGYIGLMNAHENYDPTKGTKFTTYAYTYIYGEMIKFVNQDKNIKVSRNISSLYLN